MTPASSAAAALQACATQYFDLVISGIATLGMDGLQFIVELRHQPCCRHWRAIAVTVFAGPTDRQRTLAAEFDGHLIKPLAMDALNETLQWLAQKAPPGLTGVKLAGAAAFVPTPRPASGR